jgi:hypothetical protein
VGSRHAIGFAVAALLATGGAGYEQGWSWVSWASFGAGVAVLVVAFADRLPALHKLPPPLGAVQPPRVDCYIEGRPDLHFEMQTVSGPDTVLLAVQFSHDNRHKIADFDLNVYVVGSRDIYRCAQNGARYRAGGGTQVAEGPYWTEGDIKLGRLQPMWFKVEIPEPGNYQIVVVMNSPEFYNKDGVELRRPSDVLVASRSGEGRK